MVLNRWATACKSGGPQLGIVMHKWATARKSCWPRTSVYFENEFACRIKLKTGEAMTFFFSEITFTAVEAYSK